MNPSTKLRSWNDNDEFYSFTRGRFLRDEPHQLSRSYIRFNIDELAQLAVHAAQRTGTGARRCVDIEKLADGMHNKAVRFTMDNGFKLWAKYPIQMLASRISQQLQRLLQWILYYDSPHGIDLQREC